MSLILLLEKKKSSFSCFNIADNISDLSTVSWLYKRMAVFKLDGIHSKLFIPNVTIPVIHFGTSWYNPHILKTCMEPGPN